MVEFCYTYNISINNSHAISRKKRKKKNCNKEKKIHKRKIDCCLHLLKVKMVKVVLRWEDFCYLFFYVKENVQLSKEATDGRKILTHILIFFPTLKRTTPF